MIGKLERGLALALATKNNRRVKALFSNLKTITQTKPILYEIWAKNTCRLQSEQP